ncbi:MAG TPA: hypothetical protein VKX25_15080 [Bryobacteraceae bacterium]|nr:hypothetical protein [Bryobacteraceae bacterium]
MRIVLGVTASETPMPRAQSAVLNRWAAVMLVFFFLAQLIAAAYVQRLFPRPAHRIWTALQYIGVLLLCILFSLTGAIVLEAFGWNFFLRVSRP